MCFPLPKGVCEDESCKGAVAWWAAQLEEARKKGLPLAEGSGAAVAATVRQCTARRGGRLICLY